MTTNAKLAGRRRAQKLWSRTCDIFRSMHPSPSKEKLDLLPHLTPDTQFENILIICVPDTRTRDEVENLLNVDLQKVLALAAGMQISYVLRVGEPDDDADLLDEETSGDGSVAAHGTTDAHPRSDDDRQADTDIHTDTGIRRFGAGGDATAVPQMPTTEQAGAPVRATTPRPAGVPLEDRPLPPVADSMRQSRLFDLPTTKQRERLAHRAAAQSQGTQEARPQTRQSRSGATAVLRTPSDGAGSAASVQAAPASSGSAPAAVSGPRTNSVTISSAATDPETRLNPEQTFDTFVSGQSNRFARTAAYQVAESPGLAYNPLFVYADSGLGKTHLLNAIGNYALALQPNLRVRYVNSEHFTNEFINAVRNGSGNNNGINAFNEKYRDVDMLLIDDIQFLGGKTETLEQFFHTFNSLTTAKKQIVIASDVAPKRLKGFEERIVSRFDGGLTVNMDEPSIETRIAILRMKAQQLTEQARHTRNGHPVTVPEDVLNLIASQVTGNIRELEGALIRVVAMSSLSNEPVTQQLAQKTLQDYVVKDTQHTPMDIIRRTASYFGLQPNDIVSAKRSKKIAMARQIAMYLCREMTPLSLTAVGEIFGGRDHTTVIHAYKKINREMTQKREVYNYVNTLTTELKNPRQADKTADEA